jgi:hypothetical protein
MRLASAACAVLVLLVLPVGSSPIERPARHHRAVVRFEQAAGSALVTAPIASPWEFRLVGIAWRRSQHPEGSAALRTSLDGIRWTAWTELERQDNGPDLGSPEDRGIVATEPLWVGRSRFSQLRWTDGFPPAGLSLHVIDPGSDPPTPRASAIAAPTRPGIVSRSQWGADESIRTCCPRYAPTVDYAVVHHTVSSNSYSSDESSKVVRSIYEYHVKTNGWGDIGYHFLIDRFGRVFEGRAGGIREPVIGSHAEGFNTRSTGVALIGSFQSQAPSSAAMTTLRNLLAWKLDVHHVDPRSAMTVVSGGSRKHAAGTSVRVNAIAAHRDLQITTCPGDPVYASLPKLRTDVFATGLPKIFKPRVSPSVFSPNGDGTDDLLRTSATVTGGALWTVRVRSEDDVVVRSWTGTGNLDIRWDGLNATGQRAPHGLYEVELSASTANNSATPATLDAGLYRDPWGPWIRAGTENASSPRVAAGASRKFHLVARDPAGALRHWTWSTGVWAGGSRLGTSSDVAAQDGRFGLVTDRNGVVHAAIRRPSSNNLYHGRILSDGTFTGWSRIGGAGDRGSDIALTKDRSGAVHAMTVGMNGNLYANRFTTSWSGWKQVGAANDKGRQPVLATGRGGDILAVVLSSTNRPYANKLDPNKGWRSRWSPVGDARGTEPAVAAVDEGFIIVMRGVETPNVLQTTGSLGRWAAWGFVGSTSDSGYEPAVLDVAGDVVLVVRGKTSSRLYANVRAPAGTWRGWDEAGDSLQQGARPTLANASSLVMLGAEVPGGAPATVLGRPPLRPR